MSVLIVRERPLLGLRPKHQKHARSGFGFRDEVPASHLSRNSRFAFRAIRSEERERKGRVEALFGKASESLSGLALASPVGTQ